MLDNVVFECLEYALPQTTKLIALLSVKEGIYQSAEICVRGKADKIVVSVYHIRRNLRERLS